MALKARKEELYESPELAVENLIYDYGIGIDTHSKFIAVCILIQDKKKRVINRIERDFSTTLDELRKARQFIEAALFEAGYDHRNFRYTIESTGTYHYPVILTFEGSPSIVNPLLAAPTRRKTDVLDARLLAYHSITGLWPQSYFPPEEIRVLRAIWSSRDNEQQAALRLRNVIQKLFQMFGYTFPSHVQGKQFMDVVHDWVVKGEGSSELPPQIYNEIRRLTGDYQLHNYNKLKLANIAKEANSKIAYTSGLGEVILGADLIKLLTTVPGVGEVTAITWLKEVGSIDRFPNAKAVAAFCGCDPSLKVSAGKVTAYTRRGGNVKLHYVLLKAAGALITRRSEPLGEWGYNLMKRHVKGGYKKAAGAVARRIATGLYYVHHLGEKYSYDKYGFDITYTYPKLDLSIILKPREMKVIQAVGIKDTQELCYKFNELSIIKGVGPACLNRVKDWMILHRKYQGKSKTVSGSSAL